MPFGYEPEPDPLDEIVRRAQRTAGQLLVPPRQQAPRQEPVGPPRPRGPALEELVASLEAQIKQLEGEERTAALDLQASLPQRAAAAGADWVSDKLERGGDWALDKAAGIGEAVTDPRAALAEYRAGSAPGWSPRAEAAGLDLTAGLPARMVEGGLGLLAERDDDRRALAASPEEMSAVTSELTRRRRAGERVDAAQILYERELSGSRVQSAADAFDAETGPGMQLLDSAGRTLMIPFRQVTENLELNRDQPNAPLSRRLGANLRGLASGATQAVVEDFPQMTGSAIELIGKYLPQGAATLSGFPIDEDVKAMLRDAVVGAGRKLRHSTSGFAEEAKEYSREGGAIAPFDRESPGMRAGQILFPDHPGGAFLSGLSAEVFGDTFAAAGGWIAAGKGAKAALRTSRLAETTRGNRLLRSIGYQASREEAIVKRLAHGAAKRLDKESFYTLHKSGERAEKVTDDAIKYLISNNPELAAKEGIIPAREARRLRAVQASSPTPRLSDKVGRMSPDALRAFGETELGGRYLGDMRTYAGVLEEAGKDANKGRRVRLYSEAEAVRRAAERRFSRATEVVEDWLKDAQARGYTPEEIETFRRVAQVDDADGAAVDDALLNERRTRVAAAFDARDRAAAAVDDAPDFLKGQEGPGLDLESEGVGRAMGASGPGDTYGVARPGESLPAGIFGDGAKQDPLATAYGFRSAEDAAPAAVRPVVEAARVQPPAPTQPATVARKFTAAEGKQLAKLNRAAKAARARAKDPATAKAGKAELAAIKEQQAEIARAAKARQPADDSAARGDIELEPPAPASAAPPDLAGDLRALGLTEEEIADTVAGRNAVEDQVDLTGIDETLAELEPAMLRADATVREARPPEAASAEEVVRHLEAVDSEAARVQGMDEVAVAEENLKELRIQVLSADPGAAATLRQEALEAQATIDAARAAMPSLPADGIELRMAKAGNLVGVRRKEWARAVTKEEKAARRAAYDSAVAEAEALTREWFAQREAQRRAGLRPPVGSGDPPVAVLGDAAQPSRVRSTEELRAGIKAGDPSAAVESFRLREGGGVIREKGGGGAPWRLARPLDDITRAQSTHVMNDAVARLDRMSDEASARVFAMVEDHPDRGAIKQSLLQYGTFPERNVMMAGFVESGRASRAEAEAIRQGLKAGSRNLPAVQRAAALREAATLDRWAARAMAEARALGELADPEVVFRAVRAVHGEDAPYRAFRRAEWLAAEERAAETVRQGLVAGARMERALGQPGAARAIAEADLALREYYKAFPRDEVGDLVVPPAEVKRIEVDERFVARLHGGAAGGRTYEGLLPKVRRFTGQPDPETATVRPIPARVRKQGLVASLDPRSGERAMFKSLHVGHPEWLQRFAAGSEQRFERYLQDRGYFGKKRDALEQDPAALARLEQEMLADQAAANGAPIPDEVRTDADVQAAVEKASQDMDAGDDLPAYLRGGTVAGIAGPMAYMALPPEDRKRIATAMLALAGGAALGALGPPLVSRVVRLRPRGLVNYARGVTGKIVGDGGSNPGLLGVWKHKNAAKAAATQRRAWFDSQAASFVETGDPRAWVVEAAALRSPTWRETLGLTRNENIPLAETAAIANPTGDPPTRDTEISQLAAINSAGEPLTLRLGMTGYFRDFTHGVMRWSTEGHDYTRLGERLERDGQRIASEVLIGTKDFARDGRTMGFRKPGESGLLEKAYALAADEREMIGKIVEDRLDDLRAMGPHGEEVAAAVAAHDLPAAFPKIHAVVEDWQRMAGIMRERLVKANILREDQTIAGYWRHVHDVEAIAQNHAARIEQLRAALGPNPGPGELAAIRDLEMTHNVLSRMDRGTLYRPMAKRYGVPVEIFFGASKERSANLPLYSDNIIVAAENYFLDAPRALALTELLPHAERYRALLRRSAIDMPSGALTTGAQRSLDALTKQAADAEAAGQTGRAEQLRARSDYIRAQSSGGAKPMLTVRHRDKWTGKMIEGKAYSTRRLVEETDRFIDGYFGHRERGGLGFIDSFVRTTYERAADIILGPAPLGKPKPRTATKGQKLVIGGATAAGLYALDERNRKAAIYAAPLLLGAGSVLAARKGLNVARYYGSYDNAIDSIKTASWWGLLATDPSFFFLNLTQTPINSIPLIGLRYVGRGAVDVADYGQRNARIAALRAEKAGLERLGKGAGAARVEERIQDLLSANNELDEVFRASGIGTDLPIREIDLLTEKVLAPGSTSLVSWMAWAGSSPEWINRAVVAAGTYRKYGAAARDIEDALLAGQSPAGFARRFGAKYKSLDGYNDEHTAFARVLEAVRKGNWRQDAMEAAFESVQTSQFSYTKASGSILAQNSQLASLSMLYRSFFFKTMGSFFPRLDRTQRLQWAAMHAVVAGPAAVPFLGWIADYFPGMKSSLEELSVNGMDAELLEELLPEGLLDAISTETRYQDELGQEQRERRIPLGLSAILPGMAGMERRIGWTPPGLERAQRLHRDELEPGDSNLMAAALGGIAGIPVSNLAELGNTYLGNLFARINFEASSAPVPVADLHRGVMGDMFALARATTSSKTWAGAYDDFIDDKGYIALGATGLVPGLNRNTSRWMRLAAEGPRLKDSRGNALLTQGLSGAEQAGYVAGFTPRDMAIEQAFVRRASVKAAKDKAMSTTLVKDYLRSLPPKTPPTKDGIAEVQRQHSARDLDMPTADQVFAAWVASQTSALERTAESDLTKAAAMESERLRAMGTPEAISAARTAEAAEFSRLWSDLQTRYLETGDLDARLDAESLVPVVQAWSQQNGNVNPLERELGSRQMQTVTDWVEAQFAKALDRYGDPEQAAGHVEGLIQKMRVKDRERRQYMLVLPFYVERARKGAGVGAR